MGSSAAGSGEGDGSPGDLVGAPIERREDAHLLTGDTRFTDDVQYPRETHLAIHRSRYAHAAVEDVDTSAAETMDGVLAVYTREDLLAAGLDGTLPGDEPDYGVPVDRPLLAGDRVRYQGDPIAGVVAEDRYTAHEAADAIDVSYDRLDAVGDVTDALDGDAPTVHEEALDNVAFDWEAGDAEATRAAMDEADEVVEVDLSINKVVAVPMEPRAAVARFQEGEGLTVTLGCQSVLGVQDHLSDVLGIPEHRISVDAPDVGGGFGVKAQAYTGHVLAAWCSVQLSRPVKWVATRTEAFLSTNHSRRHEVTARAALSADGDLRAMGFESTADVGAYLTQGGALVPSLAFGTRLSGAYDVEAAHAHVTGAFTNTTTLSAYRGAGRPEATYLVERLVRESALELGEDPVEFRRRNFLDPDQFPYETPFGSSYDSGDYEGALDLALEHLDYEAFRERQERAREEGRYLGIGVSSYIEICGGGPNSLQGGVVRMTPSGKVVAATSLVENGQGHATGFAQVVADELGVDYDDVEVVEGDSDRAPEGQGTGGSTAMTLGGNALKEGARQVRERAREVAAHELEASPDDVEFEDGTFHLAGAPDRSLDIDEVARAAYSGSLPPELRGLEETAFFSPDGSTAPFGTHLCVVVVDPDTGEVDIDRYVAVDDVGTQVNPTLVEGQVVGGIVQSIGQALHEEAVYDDNGQLMTGSLQDYDLPRADDVPEIEWDSTVTPSPNNPIGAKGVGEAGTIGAMPAVVNAVLDALEPFDVETLDMPITDEKVWRAIHGD
ncbi:carbon monoxide dehydrogenase [Halobacteriales archaeon QS_8_69_26]|nr:MAG: carbon monoxide dehydrogenase [Halobacteriales archaeon QS_8_69_26]